MYSIVRFELRLSLQLSRMRYKMIQFGTVDGEFVQKLVVWEIVITSYS